MQPLPPAERMQLTLQGLPVLKPHTVVKRRTGGWIGEVQKYDCSIGSFPVAWRNGFWELCGADDVTVILAKHP
jgi:hypothetical protein